MNKNSATLRLTEPVIFLRSGSDSASRRRRAGRAEYPPSLLRGLLTLKLVKPTRVKSIEVVFEGTSRTDWPDVGGGIATRRMEITEENTFLRTKIVLFHAETVQQQKRSRTVGPGVSLSEERPCPNSPGDSLDASEYRGRTTRRASNYLEPMIRQPLAELNGTTLPAIGESSRPSLNVQIPNQENYPSQDSRISIPSPIDEADLPPLYSAVGPPSGSKKAASVEPSENKSARRRSARLSLSGMLHDVRAAVQGHPNRHTIDGEAIALPPTLESERTPDELPDQRGRSRGRKDKGTIARISEAFGFDIGESSEDEDDEDTNWKEMKAGTYNYPISFTLPADLPTSVEADYGSVQYRLKAVVHRPGTFTSKLTTTTPVELISAPAEDDAEEGDAVVIERQWDTELRYLISISGRNFSQGSEIPWQMQLLPLSKMKVYRLTFMLEEKIEYIVHQHRLTRSEAVRRYQLLVIRHPQSLSSVKSVARAAPPLLPILPDSANSSSEAVLLEYADPPLSMLGEQNETQRRTEGLAHILSPDGPWHLHGVLRMPQNYVLVSHKHPLSFVSAKHALKIFMRVERGDDAVDPKTGRKKQFDIIIETPVNILSKYCRPDWASLPRYENLDAPPMTDTDHPEEDAQIHPISAESSISDITNGVFSAPMSPMVSPIRTSRPVTPTGESPRPSVGPSTPVDLNDPLRESRVQASQRFASLMAGFEDEGGDLPPTYQSVAGVPGPSRVIQVAPSPSRLSGRAKSGSREQSRSHHGSRNSSRVRDHSRAPPHSGLFQAI